MQEEILGFLSKSYHYATCSVADHPQSPCHSHSVGATPKENWLDIREFGKATKKKMNHVFDTVMYSKIPAQKSY